MPRWKPDRSPTSNRQIPPVWIAQPAPSLPSKGPKMERREYIPFSCPRPYPTTQPSKPGHSARASSTDSEDQNGEQHPPTLRCSSHPNPPAYREPLQASRPKGQFLKWLVVPGLTLPRNRPSQVTRQGQAQTDSEDPNGEQQTTLPTRVAQTTPTLQLIRSPSKPPVQRAT